jgi:hypothetical protein
VFRRATADNAGEDAGLMNATQLAAATVELDLSVSLDESEAIEAIGTVHKLASDMLATEHGAALGFNNPLGLCACDTKHIEFSHFVMVCVHCLGRQGTSNFN